MTPATRETRHELAQAIRRCRMAELQEHKNRLRDYHRLHQLLCDPTTTYSAVAAAAWNLHLDEEREESYRTTRHSLAATLNRSIRLSQ